MNKEVRIFKSMEEQEKFHKSLMSQSTVADRFKKLNLMQQMNSLLHPGADMSRKILIRKWTS